MSADDFRSDAYNATPGVQMSRTSTQAITASTLTPIQWITQNHNKWGMWVSGSNTRFTLPIGGIWLLGGQIAWASDSVGLRYILLTASGVTLFAWPQAALSGVGNFCFAQMEVTLGAGIYIEVVAYHTSTTSPLNVTSAYGTASFLRRN